MMFGLSQHLGITPRADYCLRQEMAWFVCCWSVGAEIEDLAVQCFAALQADLRKIGEGVVV